jgi:hypothetical protein
MSFLFGSGEKAFDSDGGRFSFLDSDGQPVGGNLNSRFDLTFDSDALLNTVNGPIYFGKSFGAGIAYGNGLFYITSSTASTEAGTEAGQIFAFEPNGRQLGTVTIGEGGLLDNLYGTGHLDNKEIGDRGSIAAGNGLIAFGVGHVRANSQSSHDPRVWRGVLNHVDNARAPETPTTESKNRADSVIGHGNSNLLAQDMSTSSMRTYSRGDALSTLNSGTRNYEFGRQIAIDRKRLAVLEPGAILYEEEPESNEALGRIWIDPHPYPGRNFGEARPEWYVDTGNLTSELVNSVAGFGDGIASNGSTNYNPPMDMGDGVVAIVRYYKYQSLGSSRYNLYLHIFCAYTGEELSSNSISFAGLFSTVRAIIIHHGKIYVGGYFRVPSTYTGFDGDTYYGIIRTDINGNVEKGVLATEQGLPGDMCIGGDRLWVACNGADESLLEYDLDLNLINETTEFFPDNDRPTGPKQMIAGSGVIMQASSVNDADSAGENTFIYKYDQTYGDYVDEILQGF